MGRGRSKAKHTKVARDLKYSNQDMDLDEEESEDDEDEDVEASTEDELNEEDEDEEDEDEPVSKKKVAKSINPDIKKGIEVSPFLKAVVSSPKASN